MFSNKILPLYISTSTSTVFRKELAFALLTVLLTCSVHYGTENGPFPISASNTWRWVDVTLLFEVNLTFNRHSAIARVFNFRYDDDGGVSELLLFLVSERRARKTNKAAKAGLVETFYTFCTKQASWIIPVRGADRGVDTRGCS